MLAAVYAAAVARLKVDFSSSLLSPLAGAASAAVRTAKHSWVINRSAAVAEAFGSGATSAFWQLVRALRGARTGRGRRVQPIPRDEDGAVATRTDELASLWERSFVEEFAGRARFTTHEDLAQRVQLAANARQPLAPWLGIAPQAWVDALAGALSAAKHGTFLKPQRLSQEAEPTTLW